LLGSLCSGCFRGFYLVAADSGEGYGDDITDIAVVWVVGVPLSAKGGFFNATPPPVQGKAVAKCLGAGAAVFKHNWP